MYAFVAVTAYYTVAIVPKAERQRRFGRFYPKQAFLSTFWVKEPKSSFRGLRSQKVGRKALFGTKITPKAVRSKVLGDFGPKKGQKLGWAP